MSLEIKNLVTTAGSYQPPEISLTVPAAGTATIMGKSGVGKTTMMESLCGLRPTQSGTITLAGKAIHQLRPGERHVGLVPQDAALFPHMNVREHIAFGPKLQRWSRAEISQRIDELAQALRIEDLLTRMPHHLSGGESKRVAIGRALAAKPQVLCLDEALSGLDADSTGDIIATLKRLTQQAGMITLNITHQRAEAQLLQGDIYHLSQQGLTRVSE